MVSAIWQRGEKSAAASSAWRHQRKNDIENWRWHLVWRRNICWRRDIMAGAVCVAAKAAPDYLRNVSASRWRHHGEPWRENWRKAAEGDETLAAASAGSGVARLAISAAAALANGGKYRRRRHQPENGGNKIMAAA
jgi:hypothetical protein